ARCLSCAACRDCHLCETICPTGAISRQEIEEKVAAGSPIKADYEYVSDDDKCIACGFCEDTCPCGIWTMNPY
ncbi:MAG TPA: 4Fe-4S dicluster domain-containing protein, partial [Desulfopila sp.]|nr:4Fe-4S dicluster domain-containing protein [Desulfopila sp.]